MLDKNNTSQPGMPSDIPKTRFSSLIEDSSKSLIQSQSAEDFGKELNTRLDGIRNRVQNKKQKPLINGVIKKEATMPKMEEFSDKVEDSMFNGMQLNDNERMAKNLGLKEGKTADEISLAIKGSRQRRVQQSLIDQGITPVEKEESKGMLLDVISKWGADFKTMVEDRGSSFQTTFTKAQNGELNIFGKDISELPKYEQIAPVATSLAADALGGFGEAGFKIFAELPYKIVDAITPEFLKQDFTKTLKQAGKATLGVVAPVTNLIPEKVKKGIGDKIMNGLAEITKTDKGQEALSALMDGTEEALLWTGNPENRDSVKFMEGAIELALLGQGAAAGEYNATSLGKIDDFVKDFTKKGKKLFSESADAVGTVVEKKLKKQVKREALDVIDAPMNKKERVEAIVNGLSDSTTMGGLRSNPDKYSQEMAGAIQDYVQPGMKHIKTNIEKLGSEVTKLDDGLKEGLKNSGVTFNKQSYMNELDTFAKSNKTNLKANGELKASYKAILDEFEPLLKEGNINNALEARQLFDKTVRELHGKDIGKLGFGTEDRAIDEIRTFGNNFVTNKLTEAQKTFSIPGLTLTNDAGEVIMKDGEVLTQNAGDLYQAVLKKEHLMLSAQTRIGLKNEKLLNNSGVTQKALGWMKAHPVVVAHAGLAAAGGGSYLMDSEYLPVILGAAAVGETLYFGNKVLSSRDTKKVLISMLKKGNKLGLKNTDELGELIKMLPGEDLVNIKEAEATQQMMDYLQYQQDLSAQGLTATESVNRGTGAIFKETAPITPLKDQRKAFTPIPEPFSQVDSVTDVPVGNLKNTGWTPGAPQIKDFNTKDIHSINRSEIPSYKKHLDELAKQADLSKENAKIIKESRAFLKKLEKATVKEEKQLRKEMLKKSIAEKQGAKTIGGDFGVIQF